ncbi:MAG: nuclear transport factor 2 family protein [Gemmatimonadales bacterium]|nr:MAG: nuclear transport factor 2 family protein [Gemmatimonadales bacterium]
MRRWNLFAVALLLVAPSALIAQDHDEKMEHMDATEAITAASEAFEAAWTSGDWDALGAMYTEDAVVMAPGAEAVSGRAAIAEFMSGREDGWALDLTTTEVFSVEGAALEVGDWTITAADGSHAGHGNYMVAWGWTEEGGWQMARDMWNSNMAPTDD